jgi:hypothetical protein
MSPYYENQFHPFVAAAGFLSEKMQDCKPDIV